MKITVMGGTGLIGARLVKTLRNAGHDVVAASPSTGVNTISGEGVREALAGTDVLVDVTNLMSQDPDIVVNFFRTSASTLIRHAKENKLSNYVLLSIVGTERLQDSAYFRAKLVQENLLRESGLPFTILRATQFYEFAGGIADGSTNGLQVDLPNASFQPIAADDVVSTLADLATNQAVNEQVEIAGPVREPLNVFIDRYLKLVQDPREVVATEHARYMGLQLDEHSLVPTGIALQGRTAFTDWLDSNRQ